MTNDEKQQSPDLGKEPERGIAERIKQLRNELGISVEELSELTAEYDYSDSERKGISVASLYRYEKGDREPGAREIRLLADALKRSPTWLVLGREWDEGEDAKVRLAKTFLAALELSEFISKMPDQNAFRDLAHDEKLRRVKDRRR